MADNEFVVCLYGVHSRMLYVVALFVIYVMRLERDSSNMRTVLYIPFIFTIILYEYHNYSDHFNLRIISSHNYCTSKRTCRSSFAYFLIDFVFFNN